jgi:uncharacterized protein (TIGR03083 family)
MATQAELVTIMQTEVERLRHYLGALPQDAWMQPSACALWEIRDVVAHMNGVAQGYQERITRGLRGDTSPSAGFPAPHLFTTLSGEARRQRAMAFAQRPIALRARLGTDLVSGFSRAWDPFPPLLATLTAPEWHQPCYHSCGIIPVHAVAHAGLFELAIHGWDIRSALKPSAPLSSDAFPALLDFFAACPHWFFLPAARLSSPLRYQFTFADAPSTPWDIVVAGDHAHIGPATEASAAVTFTCTQETFALLICGRLGFDVALQARRLLTTGDPAVVQTFTQWFQGA